MSWIIVRMDLEDNKVKVGWIYLRKFVLSTIRGDHFVYILLEVSYKYGLDCYSVSSFLLQSPSLKISLLFYTISPFHPYHPHADQIVDIGTCPISTFLKSLGSNWKAENYRSGITSSLMRPEN